MASFRSLSEGWLKVVFLLIALHTVSLSARYDPTWDSLDNRTLPAWFDEAKFGIFIHWGVFSVPSFGNEWFWWDWQGAKSKAYVDFMQKNYPPDFTYADFAEDFKAEFFDPVQWAQIFKDSGAKYIVFVAKHHEGYTNWPSKYSWNWNSQALGPNRDIVGELAVAIRNKTDIHFGLYHSLFEWFHPLYLKDKANHFATQDFVKSKTIPELFELVNTYQPEVIWSDGDWEASDTYWSSKEFLAWLYNDSPVKDTVVTNDRWGKGDACKHGGYYTCTDRYDPGYLVEHKWENSFTIDKYSYGYRRNAPLSDMLTIEDLLKELVTTVSCNGNLLLNVGPTDYGTIDTIFQERLQQMGSWLKVNGEAIYGSRPWSYQNDTETKGIWYTQNVQNKVVYAILLSWPSTPALQLGAPKSSPNTVVTLVGFSGQPFLWTASPTQGIAVQIPAINPNQMPCQWAWVLKLTNIKN